MSESGTAQFEPFCPRCSPQCLVLKNPNNHSLSYTRVHQEPYGGVGFAPIRLKVVPLDTPGFGDNEDATFMRIELLNLE